MEPTGPALAEQLGALTTGLHGWLAGLDPARVYAAPAEGEWSVMELFAHMTEFLGYWSGAAAIPDAGWSAVGVHVRQGEMTLPDMVSRHLIRHLAGHWEQAKASYAAVAGG